MKESQQPQPDLKELNQFLKILDRIPSTLLNLGVAYIGVKATGHWTGALTALVALQLAKGGNLAGGIAGTAMLTTLGLTSTYDPTAGGAALRGTLPDEYKAYSHLFDLSPGP